MAYDEDAPIEAEVPDLRIPEDPNSVPNADEAGATRQSFEDLPRIPFEDILGKGLMFIAARFIDSQQYEGEFAIIVFTPLTKFKEYKYGDVLSTASGAGVILERLHSAKFPFRGRIKRSEAKSGRTYFDLVPI